MKCESHRHCYFHWQKCLGNVTPHCLVRMACMLSSKIRHFLGGADIVVRATKSMVGAHILERTHVFRVPWQLDHLHGIQADHCQQRMSAE